MKKKKLKKKNKRLLKAIERLEAEKRELYLELNELVFHPHSFGSFMIKNRVKINASLDKAFFHGESAGSILKGIFNIINRDSNAYKSQD